MEMRYLKIGLILTFCFIAIFLLIKFLLPKKTIQPPSPPEEILSPEEVAIEYFSLEQQENREEAKKYLFSDLSKVEIFGENYNNLQRILWGQWKGSLPECEIENIQISENKARVVIGVKTNRIESMGKEGEFPVFFHFDSPRKIIFEVDLSKEEGHWKIVKVDLPDLILKRKLGEKAEITENVFIKPIKFEEYLPKKVEPKAGFKFLSLKTEYENKKNESLGFYFYSFRDWRLVDENGVHYKPIFDPLNPIEIPPPFPEIGPNEIKKIDVFFEISKDALLKELIFQNLDKKVIFKID